MKKALVLLLALSFVGGAFAQELSFSGGVSSGFSIHAGSNLMGDNAINGNEVKGYDNNSDPEALDFNLNGKLDADMWGIQFGMTAEYQPPSNDRSLFLYDAHAWLKLLDGIIVLRGGIVDPDGYSAGGQFLDDPGLMGGSVFKVEVAPIDGLSIGIAFHWPSYIDMKKFQKKDGSGVPETVVGGYATQKDVDDAFKSMTEDDGYKDLLKTKDSWNKAESVADFFSSMAFGVSYSADAFSVKVAARLYSKDDPYGFSPASLSDFNPDLENVSWYAHDYKYLIARELDMAMVAGVDLNVIENLNIHLSSKIDYLLGGLDTKVGLGLDVSYTLSDAMKAGIGTYFEIQDGLKVVWFRPNFTYNLTDNLSATIRIPVQLRNWDDPVKVGVQDDLKLEYWGIDLWLKYTVGKAYIQPRYNLRSYSKEHNGGKKVDSIDPTKNAGKAGLHHMVGIYMGASF